MSLRQELRPEPNYRIGNPEVVQCLLCTGPPSASISWQNGLFIGEDEIALGGSQIRRAP